MSGNGAGRKHVRLYVLCDNTSRLPGVGKEWGLSIAVALPGGRLWLFDTGQTPLFLSNARVLGLDVSTARGLALSHGHYDHTGGLWALMRRTGFQGQVYGHPDVTRERFSIKNDTPVRSIGMPDNSRRALDRLVEVRGSVELDEGLTFFTDVARQPGSFEPVQGYYFDEAGTKPERIEDDAFLLVQTPKGPVMVLGCCHSGLSNSLEHLREQTGIAKLHAVVGGLHLGYAPPEALREAVEAVRRFQVEALYAGHCTGERAAARLARDLPGVAQPLGSGRTITFG